MEAVEVQFNLELSQKLYKDYYIFERRRALKKTPFPILFSIGGGLIIIGLITGVSVFWVFGSIMTSLVLSSLFLFFLRYQIAFSKIDKELNKKKNLEDRNFTFSFNDEMIKYNSANTNSEIKWKVITNYEENGNVIYLFGDNNQLIDIISEEILTPVLFSKFKSILIDKE